MLHRDYPHILSATRLTSIEIAAVMHIRLRFSNSNIALRATEQHGACCTVRCHASTMILALSDGDYSTWTRPLLRRALITLLRDCRRLRFSSSAQASHPTCINQLLDTAAISASQCYGHSARLQLRCS